jgi:hypothetical protein
MFHYNIDVAKIAGPINPTFAKSKEFSIRQTNDSRECGMIDALQRLR